MHDRETNTKQKQQKRKQNEKQDNNNFQWFCDFVNAEVVFMCCTVLVLYVNRADCIICK